MMFSGRRAVKALFDRAVLPAAALLPQAVLHVVNRFSGYPVVDPDGGPKVSLTSHSERLQRAHIAIESIGRGALRPSSLVLWISTDDAQAGLPSSLRRLQRRGLQVRTAPNFGPHTKFYPAIQSDGPSFDTPMATADDDIIYPRRWLKTLYEEWSATPDSNVAWRAHEIGLLSGRLAPYSAWMPREGTTSGYRVFPTGVMGVIYSPRMLESLYAAGDAFLQLAPTADDVWLHHVAIRSGVRSRQLGQRSAHFFEVFGARRTMLQRTNVQGGNNDIQLGALYASEDISLLINEGR